MGAAEDKASLLDFATRAFGDAADAIDDFVSSGMEKLGYRRRIEWDDPEPEGGGGQNNSGGQGGGFSFNRQQQQSTPPPTSTRHVGGQRNGQRGGEYGN